MWVFGPQWIAPPMSRWKLFILDFSSDLYGQTLRVDFYKRLRAERKFASLDELKTQIQRDMDSTRSFSRSIHNIVFPCKKHYPL